MISSESDKAKVLEKKKKKRAPTLGPRGLNQAQNEVFRHFLELGSLIFP